MRRQSWQSEWGDQLNLSVPLHEPPHDLEDRILAAVHKTRPRGWSITRTWALVAAAALLLLAAGNVVQFASRSTTMKPGLLVVMLSGTSGAPKAFGTIVLDPDDNHGILAVRDLPLPGTGHYQLWLKKGSEIRSAGEFSVSPDGYGSLLLTIPAGFRGFHEFCVSRESAVAQVTVPTRPWVMLGNL